jgi:hypothetical protein
VLRGFRPNRIACKFLGVAEVFRCEPNTATLIGLIVHAATKELGSFGDFRRLQFTNLHKSRNFRKHNHVVQA